MEHLGQGGEGEREDGCSICKNGGKMAIEEIR